MGGTENTQIAMNFYINLGVWGGLGRARDSPPRWLQGSTVAKCQTVTLRCFSTLLSFNPSRRESKVSPCGNMGCVLRKPKTEVSEKQGVPE